MRKRLLILLAASALLILACDVASLMTQFQPENRQAQVEATTLPEELDQPEATPDETELIEETPDDVDVPEELPEDVEGPEETPTAVVKATTARPTSAPAKATTAPAKTTAASSGAGNLFAEALAKAQGVAKYRVEFTMSIGGMNKGKYTETPFMDLKGEVDGKNSHFTSKGGIMAMIAGDDKTLLEFIQANGKSYIKGMGIMGLYDPKVWYVDDNQTGSSFTGIAAPDRMGDWTSGAKPGDFRKTRSESVDGQSCDVYVYNMTSLPGSLSMLAGMFGSAESKSAMAATDKAEMSFWLCRDGYVHKFQMDFQGHDPKDAAQKGGVKVTGHTWDYGNTAISVQAPKDAKPMPK